MKTTLILPADAALGWHLYAPLIQESLDHGCNETNLLTYLNRIINFQAQLWNFKDDHDNFKGLGVTQFIEYPTHKTLHLVVCTGKDWETWADCYYDIEAFAKRNGCKAVETWGRPGWSKILPKQIPGFYTAYHVLRKNIDYETEATQETVGN